MEITSRPGSQFGNVISRGGNYLLNVGPTAQGVFPDEAIDRLQHLGKWMNTYNAAIYGNTYTPLQGQSWGQTTRKDNKLYLHVFEWPENGKLVINFFPGIAREISDFSGESLQFTQKNGGLEISLPPPSPDPDVSVLVVEIDSTEPGWRNFSAPAVTTTPLGKYVKNMAVFSGWVNAFLNGLIAFFTYRTHTGIPFNKAAVDIPITVFILFFLVTWLKVRFSSKRIFEGQYHEGAIFQDAVLRLPKDPSLTGVDLRSCRFHPLGWLPGRISFLDYA